MANHHMTQHRASTVSAWTGWVLFAAFLMGVSGVYHIITGLAALFRPGLFLVGEDKLVVLNFTQWGWIHLAFGAVLFLSAFSLASGRLWGRILGVTLVALSAIANFVFIQAYPLWSMLIILVDVVVIYSIAVHAGELQEEHSHD